MTTILAVETSRSLCSIAVQRDAELIEDTRKVERLHNQVVLAMVDDVCRRAGLEARAFDLVAFGAGPGSFTGVRIAAAVAQGIAFAADARMVPVPSSLAMADAALRQLSPTPESVVTMTRSRRDAFYLAAFAVQGVGLTQAVADVLCTGWLPELLQQPGSVAVGDRPPWFSATAPLAAGQPFWGGEIGVTAEVIARLGLAAAAEGGAVDAAQGLPIYVAGDSPWTKASPSRGAERRDEG